MSSWNKKSGVSDPYQTINEAPFQEIKLELTVAPTLTIVTRAEAKNYLKLSSDTTDDNQVDDLIKACQGIIQNELGGMSIVPQSFKQYQKGGVETIELMREPIIGTPTVSYYSDFSTVTATNITATSYFRVLKNELYHTDGYFEEGRDGDGYVIEYDTGYFTASNYTTSNNPALSDFKTAILRLVSYFYENRTEHLEVMREGNWDVTYNSKDIPNGVKLLLMPYHTGKGLI